MSKLELTRQLNNGNAEPVHDVTDSDRIENVKIIGAATIPESLTHPLDDFFQVINSKGVVEMLIEEPSDDLFKLMDASSDKQLCSDLLVVKGDYSGNQNHSEIFKDTKRVYLEGNLSAFIGEPSSTKILSSVNFATNQMLYLCPTDDKSRQTDYDDETGWVCSHFENFKIRGEFVEDHVPLAIEQSLKQAEKCNSKMISLEIEYPTDAVLASIGIIANVETNIGHLNFVNEYKGNLRLIENFPLSKSVVVGGPGHLLDGAKHIERLNVTEDTMELHDVIKLVERNKNLSDFTIRCGGIADLETKYKEVNAQLQHADELVKQAQTASDQDSTKDSQELEEATKNKTILGQTLASIQVMKRDKERKPQRIHNAIFNLRSFGNLNIQDENEMLHVTHNGAIKTLETSNVKWLDVYNEINLQQFEVLLVETVDWSALEYMQSTKWKYGSLIPIYQTILKDHHKTMAIMLKLERFKKHVTLNVFDTPLVSYYIPDNVTSVTLYINVKPVDERPKETREQELVLGLLPSKNQEAYNLEYVEELYMSDVPVDTIQSIGNKSEVVATSFLSVAYAMDIDLSEYMTKLRSCIAAYFEEDPVDVYVQLLNMPTMSNFMLRYKDEEQKQIVSRKMRYLEETCLDWEFRSDDERNCIIAVKVSIRCISINSDFF